MLLGLVLEGVPRDGRYVRLWARYWSMFQVEEGFICKESIELQGSVHVVISFRVTFYRIFQPVYLLP